MDENKERASGRASRPSDQAPPGLGDSATIPDALEFRPDHKGAFDEIVARFADGMVHVETMSKKSCYVGFYWDDGRYCQWWIHSDKRLSHHSEHGINEPPLFTAQGIDTRSAETERLSPKGESPVACDAPEGGLPMDEMIEAVAKAIEQAVRDLPFRDSDKSYAKFVENTWMGDETDGIFADAANEAARAAYAILAPALLEQGVRMGLEAAANYSGAMSHNVAMDIMRVRYGDDACDHARDHLQYAEKYIRALDPTAIVSEHMKGEGE